ncbi:MAG: hypothetical protein IKJ47_02085, partial [Oscillospiraceae bacterium]|nr:hypothetical protein [Oscillospiraceae bacterium]
TIALIVFSGIRGRIEHNDIPEAFRGIPSTLVAAAIMVIGFMGFSGMI